VTRRSKMTRWGLPILAGVLVLTIAIAQVGARNGDTEGDNSTPGDEYQVERVTIENVDVLIAESYPVQVFVHVRGYMPDPCWEAQPPDITEDGARIDIEILAERKTDEICVQVIQDYEENIALGTMEPGTYTVSINGVEREFEVY
jgi:hypothetical protein